ncbi:GNAT family N-acetyltransferase [Micromonospora sp. WMMD1082]|uniref:GNAT family N-acetyltransferase n=1 Tax=Micromonospora sp. WMMD1082 TaxID=3016104 RepID=UPI0024161796|nr:GNAT family N-acetyltransferase [Micromonospora sp. WMMD1082]MDG4794240.1 GNAT family N-acetyltransferase [Micromonospora sp. WMMD1082]
MTSATGGTGVRQAAIRRVEPADAARMRALRLEMLADAPLAFLETIAEAAARPHAEYAARIALVSAGADTAQFVADPGGRLVGHAGGTVHPTEPKVTVLYAVYITPAWRGTGLLADLVAGVAAWSRACGRDELMLEVVVGNDRAYRAYQRLGFVDTGVRAPHPTIPALQELHMRRPA